MFSSLLVNVPQPCASRGLLFLLFSCVGVHAETQLTAASNSKTVTANVSGVGVRQKGGNGGYPRNNGEPFEEVTKTEILIAQGILVESVSILTSEVLADGFAFDVGHSIRSTIAQNYSGGEVQVIQFFEFSIVGQPETVTYSLSEFETNANGTGSRSVTLVKRGQQGGSITPNTSSVLEPGRYIITITTQLSNLSINPYNLFLNYRGSLKFSNLVFKEGWSEEEPLIGVPGAGPLGNWNFDNVRTDAWADPPMAQGYTFTAADGTLFTNILGLPKGLGGSYRIFSEGVDLGTIADDQSLDFVARRGHGVTAFEVRGIQPFIDPQSPTAFPIKIRFMSDTGSFTMTPIPAPDLKLETLPNGDLKIEFDGTLESSADMSPDSWRAVIPTPASPLIVPKASTEIRQFYRSTK